MSQVFQTEGYEIVFQSARCKLKHAREAVGKSHQEIAARAGMTTANYYDLEGHNSEIESNISLGELAKLAAVLGITTRSLFEKGDGGQPLLPEYLIEKIKSHLDAVKMSVADFEDSVGFVIGPSLNNPSEILNWNIDCLCSVCDKLGCDWRVALPL